MGKLLKWVARLALALVLALTVIGVWKREEISRLLAVNSLFAEDRIVQNFSNMDHLFWTTTLSRGDGPVSPLPRGTDLTLPAGSEDWIDRRALTAMIVLKNGELRHESYHQGTTAEDRRISWSMAKSYISALLGILIEEGALSLNDPLTQHVPALKGSAYDGARIIDALHMSSGIAFNEDYLDFNSDINKMGRVLALGGSMDAFSIGQSKTVAPPGVDWHYVSIDTHVIGMAIRGATGRSIPDLMQEKLIAPLGQEKDALMITDGPGVSFVLGGLNLTTRDYARFGQMILQNGVWQGQRIVPAAWVARSATFTAPTAPGKEAYGLHWWGAEDAREGEFYARGVYGQYIYINQPENVVIVVNSADRLFREAGVNTEMIKMLRALTHAARE
jgi:CubicO group peptidase (beta-lactamase class C family)